MAVHCDTCGRAYKYSDHEILAGAGGRAWTCPQCRAAKKGGTISSGGLSSESKSSTMYWLFIGWWLMPIIWFFKLYAVMWQKFPRTTATVTGVLVVVGLISSYLHKKKVEAEFAGLQNSTTIPQSQKMFVKELPVALKSVSGADYSVKDQMKMNKIKELLVRSSGVLAMNEWEGELHGRSTTIGENLGYTLRVAGTDIKLQNYGVIATDTDPFILRKGTPLFATISALPMSESVIFSGYVIDQKDHWYFPAGDDVTVGFVVTAIRPKVPQAAVAAENKEPAKTNETTSSDRTVAAASGLNMRAQPGQTGAAIVLIPSGAHVKIIEETANAEVIGGVSGKWDKVEYNGQQGYVFDGFLSK